MSRFDDALTCVHDNLGDALVFSVKKTVYPLDVVMGTVYWFTDNFYIFVDDQGDDSDCFLIEFRNKENSTVEGLDLVVKEFGNRLIDQSVRRQVSTDTQLVRDIIVKRAFSEALSREECDFLGSEK